MTDLLPERIETDRLLLRRPQRPDADAIFGAYCQDPEVCRYMVWTPHARLADTQQFVEGCIKAWTGGDVWPYMLVRRTDDLVMGMIEARCAGHRLNIGYVLAKAHWGRGYGPEAVRAVTELALAQPGLFRVEATCDVDNLASARVLEKCGFAREGRLARYTVHPNLSPDPRDGWLYAKTR